MDFQIIEVDTPEYKQMLDLRYRILRKPINLLLSEEELAEDKNHILLGCFFLNGGGIMSCCSLSYVDSETLRLRQMAVDAYCQGRGVGEELIIYAEHIARIRGYKKIYLHARQTAIGFYEKQGYKTISNVFTEVGIPHVEMIKEL